MPHLPGSAEEEGSNFKALVKGFTDLGYIEGRMIILEHRFPNEVPDRFRSMAAELVSMMHRNLGCDIPAVEVISSAGIADLARRVLIHTRS